jgi:hypothetical protein
MDQPHDAYELSGPCPSAAPVLVVHLAGWIDASGAAAALAAVERACATDLLATFDSDTFVDYRPSPDDGDPRGHQLAWCGGTSTRHGTAPDGRDVLLLTGPSPTCSGNASPSP